jgi:hypothetical protein
MLIDLVLLRRVSRTAARAWLVSTAPTGSAAFDDVLAYIEAHPDAATPKVLARAPGRLASFLPEPESEARWQFRKRRLTQREMAVERNRLDEVASGNIDSPRSAAVARLADALRLVVLPDAENVQNACGEAGWMVQECVDYLVQLRHRYELGAQAGSGG